MSNQNATASWSGYSHQGQVGLLVALRKLRETGVNPDTHFVQFETHEDVAVYEQIGGTPTYLSVHQVKAYYSAGNIQKSKYRSVLNDTFAAGNIRYLHTAVEITDWTTSTTTNNNNVVRYPYTNTQNYCGTTDIEAFIKIELSAILGQVALPVIDAAYYRLSFELDHRIRVEHQKASKLLFDIKFSLREIDTFIRDTSPFEKRDIYNCRKLFYDTYIEIVKRGNLPQDRIDILENGIIKNINGLSDNSFLQFLQRLNLNRSIEQLKKVQIYYNHEGLRQVFFKMLAEIVDTDPILLDNSVKYNKPTEPNKFVLTAIIDEEHEKLVVIENILMNLKSQNILWESHSLINKDIEIEIIRRNPSINSVGTDIEQEDDKTKFMYFGNSKLVKREEANQKLNNGATH